MRDLELVASVPAEVGLVRSPAFRSWVRQPPRR